MRLLFGILLLLCLVFVSCNNDDPSMHCTDQAVISEADLALAPRDNVVINRLEIVDDCLLISISAGGCDGNFWEVRLIGSEFILESNPPQRPVLLSLNNDEACEAFITREYSFDITATQAGGSSIWLNFMDTEETILYEYD